MTPFDSVIRTSMKFSIAPKHRIQHHLIDTQLGASSAVISMSRSNKPMAALATCPVS